MGIKSVSNFVKSLIPGTSPDAEATARSRRKERLAPPSGSPLEPRSTTTTREPRPAKAKIPSKGNGPTSVTVGLPTLGGGVTRTVGPQRPDVHGAQPEKITVPLVKPNVKAIERGEDKVNKGLQSLHPAAHRSAVSDRDPSTYSALRNPNAYGTEVRRLFDPDGAHDAQVASLKTAIDTALAVPVPSAPGTPVGESERPYRLQLTLCRALQSICGSDATKAAALLQNPLAKSPDHFRLARALAATESGREALTKLWGLDAPGVSRTEHDMTMNALNVCTALGKAGLQVHMLDSLDAMSAALRSQAAELRLAHKVGTDADVPQQLLSQAFIYAMEKKAGKPDTDPEVATCRNAFEAWKKGGFTTSTKGSDFDKWLGHILQFNTFADRAEHGPRTFKNLARDTGQVFKRMFGHAVDPLSKTRHGVLGADLWGVNDEQSTFRKLTSEAVKPVLDVIKIALDTDAATDNDNLHKLLARGAALHIWESNQPLKGRTDIRIPTSDVIECARQMHLHHGGDAADFHPEKIEHEFLREFANPGKLQRKGKGEWGKVFWHKSETDETGAPRRLLSHGRLRLQTLEKIQAEILANTPVPDLGLSLNELRAESQRLRMLTNRTAEEDTRMDQVQAALVARTGDVVKDARLIKSGGERGTPLFQLSDLIHMWGNNPRPGPTADDARAQTSKLVDGRDESVVRFSDGPAWGVDAGPTLAINVAAATGLPAVTPGVVATVGRNTSVEIGDTLTGFHFTVGKDWNYNAGVAPGGAAAFPLPAGVAAVFGGAGGGHAASRMDGASIVSHLEKPGWESASREVHDFMWDQARPPAGTARAADKAEWWDRFVNRFGGDDRVAVSLVREGVDVNYAGANVGATVRGVTGSGMSMGPAVIAGLNYAGLHVARDAKADGGDVPTRVNISTASAAATAAVAQATPIMPTGNVGAGQVGGVLNVHGLGAVTATKAFKGELGLSRLGRTPEGDHIQWQSQHNKGFKDKAEFLGDLQTEMPRWEQALMDYRGVTRDEARAILNDVKSDLMAIPEKGDKWWGEFTTLSDKSIQDIKDYDDQLKTILAEHDHHAGQRPLDAATVAECNRIDNEISKILEERGSYRKIALWCYESIQRSANEGLDFGIVASAKGGVSANRLPYLFVGPRPDPNGANPALAVLQAARTETAVRDAVAAGGKGVVVASLAGANPPGIAQLRTDIASGTIGQGSCVVLHSHGDTDLAQLGTVARELRDAGAKVILASNGDAPAAAGGGAAAAPAAPVHNLTDCALHQANSELAHGPAISSADLMASLKSIVGEQAMRNQVTFVSRGDPAFDNARTRYV